MIFTSFWFLIFVVVFGALFYACPFAVGRSVILASANILFYTHFAGPAGMAPILVLAAATFLIARTKQPVLLNTGIVLCAGSLVTYKYTGFLMESFTRAIPVLKTVSFPRYDATVAPLAISFFVFEFVHYLYDVKSGNEPIRNLLDFLNFAMFFPTLVAGPIKRYEQFLPSLKKGLYARWAAPDNLQIGLIRIASGFAKKLLADNFSFYLTAVVPSFAAQPLSMRWVIFAEIAMRIYLDFSGYSDIAIGVARLLGIEIPENFRWPYLATNIAEFWRRWHISLTTWLRDYLFFPLGGNWAGGVARHALNLLLVFMICGLWHGAAWGFVLWGLYHGIGMLVHSIATGHVRQRIHPTSTGTKASGRPRAASPSLFDRRNLASPLRFGFLVCSWALTTLFVWSGWLLFFYPPRQALTMFTAMFHA